MAESGPKAAPGPYECAAVRRLGTKRAVPLRGIDDSYSLCAWARL
jgi:hypothetical protein